MIPSLNNQAVTEADYPKVGELFDLRDVMDNYEKWPYTCDCCRKHVSFAKGLNEIGFWEAATMNPRLVKIGEVTYFGCSTECARILFDIHSRYELLEKGGEAVLKPKKDRDSIYTAIWGLASCPACQEIYRSGATADASMLAIENVHCSACLKLIVDLWRSGGLR